MTDKMLSREFFKFGLEIITDHEGNILNIHIILPQIEYYIQDSRMANKFCSSNNSKTLRKYWTLVKRVFPHLQHFNDCVYLKTYIIELVSNALNYPTIML